MTSHEPDCDLDTLSPAEIKAVEELFLQGITGKPANVSRRLALGLAQKGVVEETVFVTGYTPNGATTRAAFRLTAIAHFRYCLWYDAKKDAV